jgi:hypothetical protein
MKTRSGFVSNSSSSSFIIGIGIVEDEEKFKAACKEQGFDMDKRWPDIEVKSLADWREDGWSGSSMRVESFSCAEVSLDISELTEETLIAVMDTGGELDGDYDFMDEDDEWPEADYDLSPTDQDYDKMSVFHGSSVRNGETCGGAGRNG